MSFLKNNWILVLIIIIIVVFTFSFRNIVDYVIAEDSSEGFKEFIIALLSVGLITLFTIGTLVVQHNNELKKHQDSEVFNDKLDLFQNIIENYAKIKLNYKITSEDLHEANITLYKIQLLGNQRIFQEYKKFLLNLSNTYNSEELNMNKEQMTDLINQFEGLINELSSELGLSKIRLDKEENKKKAAISSEIAHKVLESKYKNIRDLFDKTNSKGINPEIQKLAKEICEDIEDLNENIIVLYDDNIIIKQNGLAIAKIMIKTNSLQVVVWKLSKLKKLDSSTRLTIIQEFSKNSHYQKTIAFTLDSDRLDINEQLYRYPNKLIDLIS